MSGASRKRVWEGPLLHWPWPPSRVRAEAPAVPAGLFAANR